jgi:AraC family transcriptional regulator, carnitine catabolism transcriptional activator
MIAPARRLRLTQDGTLVIFGVMSDDATEEVGFLLLPEFPIYALVLAVEALRVANQNAGRRLFATRLFTVHGRPVAAGSGAELVPDSGIGEVKFCPTVLVVAGNQPTQHLTRGLLAWLRRLDRHGTLLGAIDTGGFALAAAGLLDGYRVTLHWEAVQLFHERHPEIEVTEQLFLSDRNRLTCAGGIATLDLMLELIRTKHGHDLAEVVRTGLIHERQRSGFEPQRTAIGGHVASVDRRIAGIVADMEAHLDQPLAPRQLAARAGISVRQLERLIASRFHDTPGGYYLKLRLQAARNHLFYGDMPIQEIATATGFSSPSVLSRSFKRRFGLSPREFREQFARERLQRFRPEVRQQLGLAGLRPDRSS